MKASVVRVLVLLAVCLAVAGRSQAQVTNQADVKSWRIWEGLFKTTQTYVNPSYDVKLKVTFTPPAGSGLSQIVSYGFWDGKEAGTNAHLFKVRTAFPMASTASPWLWSWTASCTGGGCETDGVLNTPSSYSVSVTASTGGHPLFNPGFLKVNTSGATAGRHLIHDNGTPFFWLGDTAWSASIRAKNFPTGSTSQDDWEQYVNNRKAKGFTVVQIALPVDYMDSQVNGAQPRDFFNPRQAPFKDLAPLSGRTCNTEFPNPCSEWNPEYWKNFEQKVRYANNQGFVVLVVGLAERIHEKNSPVSEPPYPNNADLQVYARNVVARLASHFVIYSPGFDRFPGGSGCTTSPNDGTCRIKAVGQQIKATSSRHLVVNHFAGSMNVAFMDPFINEAWYDFQLYQSGQGCHAASQADQPKEVTGRARAMALHLWDLTTTGGAHKPVVNGEAIYDGAHCDSGWTTHFNPYRARQTAYLSMMSGSFGYTLGVNGIYDWGLYGSSWSAGAARPSGSQMQTLCKVFRSLPAWQQLVPDHNLIVNKTDPGTGLPWADDLAMVVARDVNNQFAVAYLPNNAAIKIETISFANFETNWTKEWIDPRSGAITSATCTRQGVSSTFKCDRPATAPPAGETADWVLRLGASPFTATTLCG